MDDRMLHVSDAQLHGGPGPYQLGDMEHAVLPAALSRGYYSSVACRAVTRGDGKWGKGEWPEALWCTLA